jgi:transposase
VDAREFKGLELAAKANIRWTGAFWLVPSLTSRGVYRVNADATECSCEDFELTGRPCKHIHATNHVKARNRGTPVPELPTGPDDQPARPKKPTMPRPWAQYNAAQVREKELFLELLADLCGTVPDRPANAAGGRPRVRERDAIFAAAFKVYSGFSGRRFSTDLRDAREAGHVERAPHYNSVFRVFEDAAITPTLHRLITRSSLPLRAVEVNFAVDSSGFSTNKFARWVDTKCGVERRKAEWVKCHLCVGVKTNTVTAVEISDRHDGQAFPDLVAATAENFTLRDVTADKAYLSAENLECVETLGGAPFIPFKSRTRPDKNGATWERLWHYFHLHRDEFLPRYHQRSNVESTFSMIKRKFGDSLRSKTEVALTNELLAKVLCHNLVVLVHEIHELGIDPQFGGKPEPEADEPRLLRFPGA